MGSSRPRSSDWRKRIEPEDDGPGGDDPIGDGPGGDDPIGDGPGGDGRRGEHDFVFDANLLCLDLVNTRILRDGEPVDLIRTPGDLARWIAGAVPAHGLSLESGPPGESDDVAAATHAEAVGLREAVRAIADAALEDRSAPRRAVSTVNQAAGHAVSFVRAVPAGTGFEAQRWLAGDAATALIGEVARSAIRLLVELDPARVGRCDHLECVLYFYDVTRNRSRRWCSMERCGNRAKVAAHYWRSKGHETS